jgi:hypothetical protein
MPRRRKSPFEIGILPLANEISLLLADARLPNAAIEREPDPRERRKLDRRRRCANDCLVKMYRNAEKRGELDRIDPRVWLFCKAQMDRLGGHLPQAKGGAPRKENDRFLIAMDMLKTIERRGVEGRGSVEAALQEVAQRHHRAERYVRNIYYDPDPCWRREVLLELAMRHPDPERHYAGLQRWAWQKNKAKRDKG